MLNVIMVSVIMMSVVMLNVVILGVVAPCSVLRAHNVGVVFHAVTSNSPSGAKSVTHATTGLSSWFLVKCVNYSFNLVNTSVQLSMKSTSDCQANI
jgi:hypothetical protein